MTNEELKHWANTVKIAEGFVFNRIVYWRLEKEHCQFIERDKLWFKKNLQKFKKSWKFVEFLRGNKKIADVIFKYIENLKRKTNFHIMKVIEKLCVDNPDKEIITKLEQFINPFNDDIVTEQCVKKRLFTKSLFF
jgi:hypothetical protein